MPFDLPIVTLRPFNTFGARQSARAVIPTIIAQVLTRDVVEKVFIWGTLGAGLARRQLRRGT